MDDTIKGNSCLFLLFQVCNIALFVIGTGTLSAGLYVCISESSISWYDGSPIGLGLVTLILGYMGCKSKTNIHSLSIYCFGILACFVVQVGITVGILVYNHFSDTIGKQNADVVRYSLVGACVLIFICFIMSLCYRRSLSQGYNNLNSYREMQKPSPKSPRNERKSNFEKIRGRRENPAK